MRRLAILLALLLPAHAARADQAWDIAQSALCTAATERAEREHNLPPGLLTRIAKVESGRPIGSMQDIRPWPWTIEAAGRGLYLESRAAAVAWTEQALTQKISPIDVGCLQINLQAHPGAFASLDEAFDPIANARYAARYLREMYQEANGDWEIATGFYHSHTPDLAAEYRDRVAGRPTAAIPLYVRAIRQGTLRLALTGGGTVRINLNRQPSRLRQHHSRCEVAIALAPLLSRPPNLAGCARP